ncbi:CU044_5270 family protein [Amycolatopsis sp. cmx-11-51]|uniref:CU044_5270 family protein n=1 Tax=Amycolatopsis sp. cmx-11-51 TaxID=2785797 RepID=UPI0039E46F72
MNDLDVLRTALVCDEPTQEVIDRSRHRLQNHLRGVSTPRKRIGWLVAGSGVTAAAAAAAVLVLLPAAGAGSPPSAGSPAPAAAKTVTGQEILLAAATVAEHTPEGAGTYWHVHVTTPAITYEYWVKADGKKWFRGTKSGNQVIPMELTQAKPFSLVGVDLTLEQLRGLPTSPDALTAWITEALTHSTARTSAGPFTAADREEAAFLSLISLASTLPAPPAVRAAAFRALASYPGVRSLGDLPGGQGLLLPDGRRFVVDPATGRVNGTSVFVNMEGGLNEVAGPPGAKITAEWINDLPA